MKKNLILMLLLLAGSSMSGQEIPDGPKMVVKGNMVNTGAMTSLIPIDLQATDGVINTINNTGEIHTAGLNVSAATLLYNSGTVTVEVVPDAPDHGGDNIGNYATQKIGDTWWTVENIAFGTSTADYSATDFNDGVTKYPYTAGDPRRGYYYSWDQADAACQSLGTGWHVPSDEEWFAWQAAYDYMNDLDKAKWSGAPASLAGFRASYYVMEGDNNGWDYYGSFAYWWSSSNRGMTFGIASTGPGNEMYGTLPDMDVNMDWRSVRCAKAQ